MLGRLRTYGDWFGFVHAAGCALAVMLGCAFALSAPVSAAPAGAMDRPIHLVAFGDSLSTGYQLPEQDAFPSVLQAALRKAGYDVDVANAAVSGDTTTDGLARLDWSVPDGTDGVILELGANDMLRGIDPKITRQNLSDMLKRLKARHIAVLLVGMKADPSLGADYGHRFEAIYPDLAKQFDVPLYPFFLAGVAGDPKLNLQDGMHPTPQGVRVIVKDILPDVEALIRQVRTAASP